MTRSFHLTTVRSGNVINVLLVSDIGIKETIGQFLLPNDGQWRLDVDFLDDIQEAYRKRLRKTI